LRLLTTVVAVRVTAPGPHAVNPAPIASVVVVVAAAAAATTATAKPKADAAAAVAAVTAAAVSAATAAVTPAAAVANELHVRLFGAFDFLFEDIKCAQAYV
jgi:hypothetical protein